MPSKQQLMCAVSALLPVPGKLSKKWDKTQLATVLSRWLTEALTLSPISSQKSLMVEISTRKGTHKAMEHEIFLEEDDGSVSTLSINSPAAKTPRPRVPHKPQSDTNDAELAMDGLAISGPCAATPNTILSSASSFMRQIAEVSDLAPLAATPLQTDPGVGGGDFAPTPRPTDLRGVRMNCVLCLPMH